MIMNDKLALSFVMVFIEKMAQNVDETPEKSLARPSAPSHSTGGRDDVSTARELADNPTTPQDPNSALFGARHAGVNQGGHRLAARDGDEAALDLVEQSRWQRAVIAAGAVERPDIRPRPDKPIAFGEDNPRAIVIKAEPALDVGRDLDSASEIGWRRVGDRQNSNNRNAGLVGRHDR